MRARLFALPAAAGLALIALPALPALAAPTPQGPYCVPDACVVVYDTPGAADSFVVPAGVTVLAVGVGGASGGDGQRAGALGGTGGALETLVPVTPGETLSVLTGAPGTAAAGVTTGGSGGGGSFVFRGADVLVAAGGGGGGGRAGGGAGGAGGPVSTSELAGADAESATLGGGGGQVAAGGTAPAPTGSLPGADGTGPATGPATPGAGGAATLTAPSGGGGSGWFGGASGSCDDFLPVAAAVLDCGGGGGGSAHVADGVTISDVGTREGDGIVVISYTALASTTTLTAVPSTIPTLGTSDLTATVTGATPAPAKAAPKAAAAMVATKMGTSTARAAAAAVAAVTPTGTVTFFSGTTAVFTAPVDPTTGVARAVFTAGSTPGPRTITAQYNGDVNYLQSTSAPATITVVGAAPTTPAPGNPQGGGAQLPDTGTDHVAGLLATSAALLLGGAGVLLASRRRTTPRHGAAG